MYGVIQIYSFQLKFMAYELLIKIDTFSWKMFDKQVNDTIGRSL